MCRVIKSLVKQEAKGGSKSKSMHAALPQASIDTRSIDSSLSRPPLMNSPTPLSAEARLQIVRDSMPSGGMFRDKEWLLSPEAFPLPERLVEKLKLLGSALRAFQIACNDLYLESTHSNALGWIANLLDQGKPERMVELGRQERWRKELPRVIRPDLILTETGVSIAELDSLPGGIGLTAWLGKTYAGFGDPVIGGAQGMIEGFAKSFPKHDLLISRESSDYEPEMQWLTQQLNALEGGERRVLNPWNVEPKELTGRSIYRFFELWDIDNVEHGAEWLAMAERGEIQFTPPLKPYMEEKLWLALFWSPALQHWWKSALSEDHLSLLRECIPYGWVLDPVTLPLFAEWPQLGIHSWEEMKRFGNKQRELVIKISGYSETSWGSRGVKIGHDLPQPEWSAAIDEALNRFSQNPHLMQRFHRGRIVAHPFYDEAKQAVTMMQARVRLCPYYFLSDEEVNLGGILATVVPSDKKLLHGMRDAVMLPCVVG